MLYNNNRTIFNGIRFVKLVSPSFNSIFICSHSWKLVKEFFNFYFTEYRIFLNAAPGLSYTTTSSYTIPVTCSDNYGTSAAASLTVNVVANTGPVISGLPTSVSVTESDTGGSSIYTLTVTDPDPYTCSIQSSTPTTTFFSMVKTGARK